MNPKDIMASTGGELISAETAAKIWQALTKELRRPGAEQQRKMAASAMAGDTSTDHIESKAIIAKVCAAFSFHVHAITTPCC